MRSIATISPSTQLCGIIGNPVGHSMSPALHNRAFSELDLDYVYLAFRVEPGNVGRALDGIRAMENFRGLSVTIPHKVEVVSCVDEISDTDKSIGSINTIINDGGCLRGLGSDGPGARQAMLDNGLQPAGSRVTIIGTGGASRAIAFDLAFNARPEKLTLMGVIKAELSLLARDIAEKTDVEVEGVLIDDASLTRVVGDSSVLINATPVGMHPNVDQSVVPADLLHSGLGVMDIVYNPLCTKLLSDAKEKGLVTVSGLEMFVNQAVIQFESWTGCDAPKEAMREVVLQWLTAKG
ncbi:MAG: shikimate dehydrogenase [Kiritimatiellae bacterium]|jgi:shikimate dehydrogenase|nr:shikimate dehydrogenase [Kiritimatiellia bacterium]